MVTPSTEGLSTPCDIANETKTHIAEIRFSNKEFYRFAFQVQMFGFPSMITGGCAGTGSFHQIGGVPGAKLEIFGDDVVIWRFGTDIIWQPRFPSTLEEPFQPSIVLLTTPDGRQFDFAGNGDLLSMTDSNGNSLTINEDGIHHSSGRSIAISRDTEGRISMITDPMGRALLYSYFSNGDLTN